MPMEPSREQLAKLARMVARTASDELDCGEILDRLPALLESTVDGRELAPELAQVRQHLDVCPPCLEEFDALLELVRESRDGS